MLTIVKVFAVLLLFALQMPRNDPTGIWQAETGTQYKMELVDSDLKVQLVDGSNPVFVKYEVILKNQQEVNTYKGKGYFVANLEGGRECKFDTDWEVVVVGVDRIIGVTSTVQTQPGTCEIKERGTAQIDLSRKK